MRQNVRASTRDSNLSADESLVSIDEVHEARRAIAGQVHRTPVMGSSYVGNAAGVRAILKLELFQKTGSFKVRGVSNTLRQLSESDRARGVISLSAGNHAQALAWGAARYGISATIVMPTTAVPSKVAATRAYGGNVVQTDGDLLATALELQRKHGSTLVHPFDDARMIAGHASVGLEILEDVPDVDVVLVACGGGGLISGVAAAIKQLRPEVRVIGIEPEGSAAMTQSLAAGSPQRLAKLDTIADGLAAPFAGTVTFRHCAQFVDEWVIVSDAEIAAAMRVLMERCKLVAEPAAATAIVPLLTGALALPRGQTVVPVICGGNIDSERLTSILSRFPA
jgi:threonine dehydratase